MMRDFAFYLVVALSVSAPARADDSPQAIIDKAIKALGGKDKLNAIKALQVKTKGTLNLKGTLIPIEQETLIDLGGRFREVMMTELNGEKIKTLSAHDGVSTWIKANDKEIPLDDDLQAEVKEEIYKLEVGRLTPLTSSTKYTLTPLEEIVVDGRPAEGVRVSSRGHKDINIYFDKETGLTAKISSRRLDFSTRQEIEEERFPTDYADQNGIKMARKIAVRRNGQRYLEMEVLSVKFLDSIPAADFAKP
jgi:hypothetical protein